MRPNWDEYFMAVAIACASRSSCRHVRAGSVFVLDKRIVGTGYNGSPPGVKKNCLEAGCRKENLGLRYEASLNSGKCIGIHAEMNALGNLSREIHQGATLYTTVFPCPACTKNLLAYGVKKVVYKKEYNPEESKLSIDLLREAGVEVEKLDLSADRLKEILFSRQNVKFDVF